MLGLYGIRRMKSYRVSVAQSIQCIKRDINCIFLWEMVISV